MVQSEVKDSALETEVQRQADPEAARLAEVQEWADVVEDRREGRPVLTIPRFVSSVPFWD